MALAFGLPAPGHAQGAPTAEQMIEQLKGQPPAASGPRSRSLRNLTVEAAPADAPAAAPAAPPVAVPAAAPVAAPVAAPSAAPAARPSLSLLIQFDFNSARVKTESEQSLTNLALALQSKELAASRFAVEGHTDAKGRADYNLRLSQQRAEAVRDYLAQRGVNGSRLVASGKGSTELAVPADPGAAENRRVRIVNLD
jgi:outer membrane protein OmpA-like peptidoglycan-associated protein